MNINIDDAIENGSKRLVLFVDLVGRTIIGNAVPSTPEVLNIENPAIVHIQPVGKGQLQVQVMPYLVPEFITSSKRKEPVTWSFPRTSIIVPQDLEVDPQLKNQYDRIFSALVLPPETTPVINLFEDKK